MKKILLTCTEESIDKRLDKFIIDEINKINEYKNILSRNKIQELIKNSFIKKNKTICNDISCKVKKDDIIEVVLINKEEIKLEEKNIYLNILYEDNDLLIINKQAGLTVHPGAGNFNNTLVNALLYHCKNNLSTIGGEFRPGIVHRLDKDTTGVMVIAKNNFSHINLKEQLEKRILQRVYNAIIWGNIYPENGEIDGYINRYENNRLKMKLNTIDNFGKYSLTHYKTIEKYGNIATLMECKLETGRTHQIRVHFSTKKHPLMGDLLYGGHSRKIPGIYNEYKNFIDDFPRQALHSKSITLIHPRTKKEIHIDTNLPNDMKLLINCLKFYKN